MPKRWRARPARPAIRRDPARGAADCLQALPLACSSNSLALPLPAGGVGFPAALRPGAGGTVPPKKFLQTSQPWQDGQSRGPQYLQLAWSHDERVVSGGGPMGLWADGASGRGLAPSSPTEIRVTRFPHVADGHIGRPSLPLGGWGLRGRSEMQTPSKLSATGIMESCIASL